MSPMDCNQNHFAQPTFQPYEAPRNGLPPPNHKAPLPTALSNLDSSFAAPSSSLTTSRPDIAAPVDDYTNPSSPPALGVTDALQNMFVNNDKHKPDEEFDDDDYGDT